VEGSQSSTDRFAGFGGGLGSISFSISSTVFGVSSFAAFLKIGQRVRFEERTSKHSGKPEAYAVALL
jgi:hypothetical protein